MSAMDRRTFSKLAAAAWTAPLATLGACGGGSSEAAPAEPQGIAHATAARRADRTGAPTVVKLRAAPNPTGLKIGFWENFKRQDLTLATMGRRPSSRVAFYNWDALEDASGRYLDPSIEQYARVHRYGQSILGAINVCFRIPERYENDIALPATCQAAKAFLAHHVQWLLANFGSATLTIDYEIVSNYLLAKGTDLREQALKWRNWMVDHALPTARQAAAGMGLPHALKLQPIFNGNPATGAGRLAHDPVVVQALRDVVAASDYLALDTYFHDGVDVTDASHTIKTIQFWYETYAKPCRKQVVVTENGFSTARQWHDVDDRSGKLVGTEAQQDAYFKDLFAKLQAANRRDGVLENQLRGFHIWCIVDNDQVTDLQDRKRYFGLHRLGAGGSATPKPAAATVRQAIETIESDPFHRPTLAPAPVDNTNLWDKLHSGKPVSLHFDEGDDHDFLRYTDAGASAPGTRAVLKARFARRGNLLVQANGAWLIAQDPAPGGTSPVDLEIDLGPHYFFNRPNTIDIYATGQVFPVRQQILSLTVAYA